MARLEVIGSGNENKFENTFKDLDIEFIFEEHFADVDSIDATENDCQVSIPEMVMPKAQVSSDEPPSKRNLKKVRNLNTDKNQSLQKP